MPLHPMRRTVSSAGVVSAQSLDPVIAVGTAAAMPTAISRSEAWRDFLPPNRSSRVALVHMPIGRSVRSG